MAFLGVKVCTIALTAPFMKVRTGHLFKGKGRALVGLMKYFWDLGYAFATISE